MFVMIRLEFILNPKKFQCMFGFKMNALLNPKMIYKNINLIII